MFIAAAQARRSILRNFRTIGYRPNAAAWRALKMGIKRNLQAQSLRPNIPIPRRREVLRYLNTLYRETGSIRSSLISLCHDGAWTSSGGSFRLAQEIGVDLFDEADRVFSRQGRLCYLEIGGGWAGLKTPAKMRARNIAGLGKHFERDLGRRVLLHFTNLTQWHTDLPDGIVEHPFVTAAGLSVVERQGVPLGSVDIIYSQAAAYFEPDLHFFIESAAALLTPEGLLIFNHPESRLELVSNCAKSNGLTACRHRHLAGMNGIVVAFEKEPPKAEKIFNQHRQKTSAQLQNMPA